MEQNDTWNKLMGPHEPDLDGLSDVVKERFNEAIARTIRENDYMKFIDDMERAMIGTARNANGVVVAVYEQELCIKCKMESYGPDWAENIGIYTKEQMADKEYMASELYTTAAEDYYFNTVNALPYEKEHAPIIVEAFHDGEDRSDADRGGESIIGKQPSMFDDALIGTYRTQECEDVAVYDAGLLGNRLEAFHRGVKKGEEPLILRHFKVDDTRFEKLREQVNETVMEGFMYA